MGEKIHDIFGPGSNVKERIIRNYDCLMEKVSPCKKLGLKVVLTSGTFDLFHIGHSRYLESAKKQGDVLVVGIDSDEKVRQKKGPHRPIVNEDERLEIVCHCRHVDLVVLKQANDPKWHLIKTVCPDVLITTQRVYKEVDLVDLREYCGEIKVLESQATTSTTAKIRSILVEPASEIRNRLMTAVKDVCGLLDVLTKGGES